MKISKDRRNYLMNLGGSGGSVLVMAMILVAIGTIAMTSGIVLLHARARYTEQHLASVQRRIAENNGRALTRQYLLEKVIASGSGSGGTFTAPGGTEWGGTVVPAWTDAAMSATDRAAPSVISPAGGLPYAAKYKSTITSKPATSAQVGPPAIPATAAETREYQAYIRSRSPLLSGDVFVVHSPFGASLSVSGALDVKGRAVIHAPSSPNSYNFTADDFSVPTGTTGFSINNSSNTALAGSNFPLVPETAGPSGSDLGYTGNLSVVDNPGNPGNSLYGKLSGLNYEPVSGATAKNVRGIVSNGTGDVSITLDDDFMTNVIVTNAATVTLVGQNSGSELTAADGLPGIMILVLQGGATDLSTVSFQGGNNRRVLLAIKKTTSVAQTQFNFTASQAALAWRLMVTAESCPIEINKTVGGSLDLFGGIRTNGSLAVAAGTSVALKRELDPKKLNFLADRRAWVELYK